MNVLARFFFTIYIWTFFLITIIPCFIIYSLIWLLTFRSDRKRMISHHITCLWATLYFKFAPGWRLRTEGYGNFVKGRRYVIISNHESLLDIILLMQLFIHFRWITKIEMAGVPVLGWVIRMNKYITVRRGDKESKAVMTAECKKSLEDDVPVFLFPEGTRSLDGSLNAFKDGAFIVAMENNVPVLPVLIHGPYNVLPKRGFLLKSSQLFRIKILKEISPSDFSGLTPGDAADLARDVMQREIELMRA
jgi:1-acyl-sn-glycerol-3-phosphate acyltransferase